MDHKDLIVVLDFGSQYSQLIARRVRELGVYSELHPFNISIEDLRALRPSGIILSGGPSSVYARNAPHPSPEIYALGVPVLGICYGLQVIAHQLGGKVDSSARHEYGPAKLIVERPADILRGFRPGAAHAAQVWMSHGDALTKLPKGFSTLAHSSNSRFCVIRDPVRKIFGVQFHPEVAHTPRGINVLKNFIFTICRCHPGWDAGSFIEASIARIRKTVGGGTVLCAVSGGVDSTVLAVLLQRAVGARLHCIHIDNGLMRKDESSQLVRLYRERFKFNFHHIDAGNVFLKKLKGISEPEQKRKIIGETFIRIFEKEARAIGGAGFLAQGTLYPDVIESVSYRGPSHTIKTHHNVGGLPRNMKFELIEPFRELFKDEVRRVGIALDIEPFILKRHPFPGPGLAVRIIGDITKEKLELLRSADAIFNEEIRSAGLYETVWQAFAVLLPVQTVGVMGDQRTYENVIALRAVTSVDGMTADWAQFTPTFLSKVSGRIVNEVRGVNRVVYDISSKPPSTIEWE